MNQLIIRLFVCVSLCVTQYAWSGNDVRNSAHAKKTLEIYRKVISMPTVAGRGKVPEMASYLSSELRKAGFAKDDIEIIPKDDTAALVVKYRGDGSSGKLQVRPAAANPRCCG